MTTATAEDVGDEVAEPGGGERSGAAVAAAASSADNTLPALTDPAERTTTLPEAAEAAVEAAAALRPLHDHDHAHAQLLHTPHTALQTSVLARLSQHRRLRSSTSQHSYMCVARLEMLHTVMAQNEDPGAGADVNMLLRNRVRSAREDRHVDVDGSSDYCSIPLHWSQEVVTVDDDKLRTAIGGFHQVEREMDRWRRRWFVSRGRKRREGSV